MAGHDPQSPPRDEAPDRLLLDQLPAVVWATDSQLRLTTAAGVCRPPDPRPDASLAQFLQANSPDAAGIAAHQRALQGELALFEQNWSDAVYQCRVAPLRDTSGRLIGCVGIAHDITERKRTEQTLLATQQELQRRMAEIRFNEARLEAVLHLSHMTEASLQEITDFALEQAVALTKSKLGYLAFMNPEETVLTMHSWSKDAMAECAIIDKPRVYPLETTGLWGEAARQRKPIVTNDYAAPNPWKKGLPPGHVKLLRHMNVPIMEGGRVVVVAGVANKDEDYDDSDVRQLTLLMEGMWRLIRHHQLDAELRKHRDHLAQLVAEQTEILRQNRDELQAVYDGVVDSLMVVDAGTKRFLRVNPSACRMLGYSSEEMLSLSVLDIHPPDQLPAILEKFQAHADTSGMHHEVLLLRKDGSTLLVEVRSSHIVYHGRPCLVAFFRDITERKKAQEALEREFRTLKHLLQSSDHERQTIAYDIHDGLAQQIAAALMQFQMYEHGKDTMPDEAAQAHAAGMAVLRQSHVEVRRLISGVRPPILDESGIVAAIAHLVHDHALGQRLKTEFHSRVTFQRLAPVVENAIYRIVQEGLANAWKHSRSEKARVSLTQYGDCVRIQIRDWGIGFSPTAVPEGHFGLEGIRQRVRLLGGRFRIASAPQKGTRLVVKLPIGPWPED